MSDKAGLPTSVKEAAKRYDLPLKGWFIEAADTPLAPYADEDSPERTIGFFQKFLGRRESDDAFTPQLTP